MLITIRFATPLEAVEVVRQLLAANAGLRVSNVRYSPKTEMVYVVLHGTPDDMNLDIEDDTHALKVLRQIKREG